jgi:two-component system, NarL family, nitrate/nitrite response regulator NarL
MVDSSTSGEQTTSLLDLDKSGVTPHLIPLATPAIAEASVLILSDIRFFREGLAEILARGRPYHIAVAATVAEAVDVVQMARPDMVLIDTTLPDGRAAVTRLHELAPDVRLVALAVAEVDAEIIAWAEAGVCGYLPRSAALHDLVGYLDAIMHGEQSCSKQVAAALLRWISIGRHSKLSQADGVSPPPLTVREEEIAALVGAGFSNKEIARLLSIGLATTKTHVHNLLGKLGLERRTQVARRFRSPLANR